MVLIKGNSVSEAPGHEPTVSQRRVIAHCMHCARVVMGDDDNHAMHRLTQHIVAKHRPDLFLANSDGAA